MMALAVLVAAGCESEIEMYPVHPGGGGGGGSFVIDAGVDATTEGTMVTGRVCAIDDARAFEGCPGGAANVTVTIGTATAMTSDTGDFTLTRMGGGTYWLASGAGFVPAALPTNFGVQIPMLTTAVYEQMVTNNPAVTGNGTGAIIMQVRNNGTTVANATATATPAPGGAIYYDSDVIDVWETDTTQASGVIWIPGMPAGTASVTVTSTNTKTFGNIPVVADTITFVFATL